MRILGREKAIAQFGPVIVRPADKKDHYVKRCVAIPGDTLTVQAGLVWVNGQQEPDYPGRQLTYQVITTGSRINPLKLDQLGLNLGELYFDSRLPGYPAMPLTEQMLEKVKALPTVVDVTLNLEQFPTAAEDSAIFPFTGKTRWTADYFGPLWIPSKGATVALDAENLPLYERIIRDYEHNRLEVTPQGIFINGEAATTYTFQHKYWNCNIILKQYNKIHKYINCIFCIVPATSHP